MFVFKYIRNWEFVVFFGLFMFWFKFYVSNKNKEVIEVVLLRIERVDFYEFIFILNLI